MCYEGEAAFKGRVISDAWRTCERGTWMAWWLFRLCTRPVSIGELRRLRDLAGSPGLFISDDFIRDQRYADIIRARYTSTGRPRKTRRK